jgi:hypothetical protein
MNRPWLVRLRVVGVSGHAEKINPGLVDRRRAEGLLSESGQTPRQALIGTVEPPSKQVPDENFGWSC